MNASLPPEDERREEQEDVARQDVPVQTKPRISLGTVLGIFLAVATVALLVLPSLPFQRVPAQRSTHAELERRQQAIEQAVREANDEDGLADSR